LDHIINYSTRKIKIGRNADYQMLNVLCVLFPQIENLNKQKSELKIKLEKLRLELKKQKEMYGNAHRGMLEAQKIADARKEEVISKNTQIGKMETRIISLEGKVDGLRQELSKSQTSLEIVLKQKENMQHELVALQKSNEDLQDALEEMKTKKDELQNEVLYSIE